MSSEPPTDRDKVVIYTTECPVSTCSFVAVTDESKPGIEQMADHVEEEHEPWEMPDEDISHLIDAGEP